MRNGEYYIEERGDGYQLFQRVVMNGQELHPLNLVHLSDFDKNGEQLRELIVKALNEYRDHRIASVNHPVANSLPLGVDG